MPEPTISGRVSGGEPLRAHACAVTRGDELRRGGDPEGPEELVGMEERAGVGDRTCAPLLRSASAAPSSATVPAMPASGDPQPAARRGQRGGQDRQHRPLLRHDGERRAAGRPSSIRPSRAASTAPTAAPVASRSSGVAVLERPKCERATGADDEEHRPSAVPGRPERRGDADPDRREGEQSGHGREPEHHRLDPAQRPGEECAGAADHDGEAAVAGQSLEEQARVARPSARA